MNLVVLLHLAHAWQLGVVRVFWSPASWLDFGCNLRFLSTDLGFHTISFQAFQAWHFASLWSYGFVAASAIP